jgi:hypothetical protein
MKVTICLQHNISNQTQSYQNAVYITNQDVAYIYATQGLIQTNKLGQCK